MKNLINCGTCGYPLTPEERTSLIERGGVMVKEEHTKDEALALALEALKSFQNFIEDAHIIEGQWHWIDGVDKAITAIKQARSAPALEGWKLVPMEPTREMWTAVNKLDDQCAAGNYDGKGCSIEQAWNCLLDAAPTPPAAQRPVPEERKWVGLTDEEIDLAIGFVGSIGARQDARAIEAKLKEKNSG